MALQLLATTVIGDQPTIVWNPAAFPVASVTLQGNRTFGAPGPLQSGATYSIFIRQDTVGGRTITWNPVFKWPAGLPPTLSAAAGAVDIVSFITDGINMFGVPQNNFS